MLRRSSTNLQSVKSHLRDLEIRLVDASKVASRECAWLRYGQAACILLLRGYGENIAYESAENALRAAMVVIESGAAADIPDRETWFLSRAVHYANYLIRRPRRDLLLLERPELVVARDKCFSVSDEPTIEPCAMAIEGAIKTLPLREAAAIGLFRRGYSYKAIGKELTIAASTAHGLVNNAIRYLRISLQAQPNFPG
ncbi:MAG TPA: hypothetical protein VFE62_09650 [Gemmataceae bacterium]|nr:hypothetical protein [Gemmataceae bacterium]